MYVSSSLVGRFLTGKRTPVPSGQEATCILQPVSMLCLCRDSKLDFLPVALLPEKELLVPIRQQKKLGPRYCLEAPNGSGFDTRISGRPTSSLVTVVSKLFRRPLSSDTGIAHPNNGIS